MNKNILYGVAAAVSLAVLGAVAFYLSQRQAPEPERSVPSATETREEGLGSQLYENPAAEVPDTNPFEAETNPFQQAKTNPFEDYQNPFAE